MVKFDWKSVSAFPTRSVTPWVTTTLMSAAAGSVSVRVTVRPSPERLMLGEICVSPLNSVKVWPLIVFGFSGLENVITTGVFWPAPLAPLAGVTEVTVGGVVSVPAAMVNDQVLFDMQFPAKSYMHTQYDAYTFTVAPGVNGLLGVNTIVDAVAVLVTATVPVTTVVAPLYDVKTERLLLV